MPVFTKHLILPACALGALLAWPSAVHAKDYPSCLSEKLKGISNDAAIKAITDACRAQYPEKKAAPVRVAGMTPLSEVESISEAQFYENKIHTMYNTTNRITQEVTAREILTMNPNAITEDFRFIEAMLLNGVGYARVNEMVDRLRHNNAQLNILVSSMYQTYCGQMTPENEIKAFKALIYTLYRNDKRYSENGGNNAHMTSLQQVYARIYEEGNFDKLSKFYEEHFKNFHKRTKQEQINLNIILEALNKNSIHNYMIAENKNSSDLDKTINRMASISGIKGKLQEKNLLYSSPIKRK